MTNLLSIKVKRSVAVALVVLCWLCSGFSVQSQELDSERVKAAYLYNFLKHINWPIKANRNQYIVATYQNPAFFKVLEATLANRQVKGKSIVVQNVANLSAASQADLLFLSANHNVELPDIAAAVRSTETLLVTINSDNKHDIMINLVYTQASAAMTFEVNKSNIIYEKLSISKELLLLGGTELDVAMLYRETEQAMQVAKRDAEDLKVQIVQQQQELDNSTRRLTALNRELSRSTNQVAEQRIELSNLKAEIVEQLHELDDKESELALKEQQLARILRQLDSASADYQAQQQAFAEMETDNLLMAERIDANKQILEQQDLDLKVQQERLAQQNQALASHVETIDTQQRYILITTALVVIAILVSILSIALFLKNRRTTRTLSQTLSNLEQTQDQLIQSEKMASLGTLTAGVAHEINTPLGIAVTATSLVIEQTHKIQQLFNDGQLTKGKMRDFLSVVDQSSSMSNKGMERVVELLNNFKQVAADQVVGEARQLNLVAYVNEVISTLSPELKRNKVTYRFICDLEELPLKTIPGAFAQVLTNLVTNAIRHGFDGRPDGNISIQLLARPKGGAEIIFTDDGVGMSKEVIEQIYDPFFTTKRNTGGTGLGMNIVYNVVNNKLKGEIYIDSAPNRGTAITLLLPETVD